VRRAPGRREKGQSSVNKGGATRFPEIGAVGGQTRLQKNAYWEANVEGKEGRGRGAFFARYGRFSKEKSESL